MNAFDKAHEFVFLWEGGFDNHPNDPGGPTNYGVSLRFLQDLGTEWGDLDFDGDIDIDDIRLVTPDKAKELFKAAFWDKLRLDEVKPLCAFVLYDTAVNMGIGYARKLFQKAVGITADGIWGPVSWGKLRSCDDRKTALAMIPIRRRRYIDLAEANPRLKPFLKGWKNRVDDLGRKIEKM